MRVRSISTLQDGEAPGGGGGGVHHVLAALLRLLRRPPLPRRTRHPRRRLHLLDVAR